MKKIIYPLIAVIIIALDQISKYAVRANMQPGDKIPIIGNFFKLYYVQNTGTAFSMFSGNRFITIFLTSALIIGCVLYVIKEHRDREYAIAILLSFVAAGGISNMIDRLSLGFVTDMISVGSFAVFNVADIFVTTGCLLVALLLILEMRNEKEASSKSDLKGGCDE